jgi:hypothetical protein
MKMRIPNLYPYATHATIYRLSPDTLSTHAPHSKPKLWGFLLRPDLIVRFSTEPLSGPSLVIR